jgi:hypothetical protein
MPLVSACCMRVMRGFLVLACVMMLSSLRVVLGGMGAVFGCFSMMFGGLF